MLSKTDKFDQIEMCSLSHEQLNGIPISHCKTKEEIVRKGWYNDNWDSTNAPPIVAIVSNGDSLIVDGCHRASAFQLQLGQNRESIRCYKVNCIDFETFSWYKNNK